MDVGSLDLHRIRTQCVAVEIRRHLQLHIAGQILCQNHKILQLCPTAGVDILFLQLQRRSGGVHHMDGTHFRIAAGGAADFIITHAGGVDLCQLFGIQEGFSLFRLQQNKCRGQFLAQLQRHGFVHPGIGHGTFLGQFVAVNVRYHHRQHQIPVICRDLRLLVEGQHGFRQIKVFYHEILRFGDVTGRFGTLGQKPCRGDSCIHNGQRHRLLLSSVVQRDRYVTCLAKQLLIQVCDETRLRRVGQFLQKRIQGNFLRAQFYRRPVEFGLGVIPQLIGDHSRAAEYQQRHCHNTHDAPGGFQKFLHNGPPAE